MLIEYRKPIRLIGAAAVGGSMELSGPLGEYLDLAYTDDRFDADSWESAEANMVRYAIERALYKLSFRPNDVDLLLAGDLLNQCTASSYGAADFGIPYCGLYNACATFALGCLIAGLSIESARSGGRSRYPARIFPVRNGNIVFLWNTAVSARRPLNAR